MPDVYQLENNILVAEYSSHAYLHQQDVEEELNKRLKLTNEPHYVVVKLRGLCIFGEDAKSFVSSEIEAKHTLAVAIVFEQGSGYREHGKILVESFLWLNTLKYPARVFDHEEDALAWLRELAEK